MKYTPEMILDAVVAVFDTQGVGVSTAALAKGAGVSNGTLFNYFPTKQDLLDALYLHLKTDLALALGEIDPTLPLQEQSKLIYDRWFAWASSDPAKDRVAGLLNRSGLASEEAVAEAQVALASPARVLTDLEASGLLVDLPVDYVAALLQAQIELAVATNLSTHQRNLAFEVMWNSITRSPTHQGVPQ